MDEHALPFHLSSNVHLIFQTFPMQVFLFFAVCWISLSSTGWWCPPQQHWRCWDCGSHSSQLHSQALLLDFYCCTSCWTFSLTDLGGACAMLQWLIGFVHSDLLFCFWFCVCYLFVLSWIFMQTEQNIFLVLQSQVHKHLMTQFFIWSSSAWILHVQKHTREQFGWLGIHVVVHWQRNHVFEVWSRAHETVGKVDIHFCCHMRQKLKKMSRQIFLFVQKFSHWRQTLVHTGDIHWICPRFVFIFDNNSLRNIYCHKMCHNFVLLPQGM